MDMGLHSLVAITRFHQLPAEPEQLQHQYGQPDDCFGDTQLLQAAKVLGGVLMEAQQLMLIVPNEEQLEVQVFLQNKDIGFVEEGMDAEIKIHTFPFTKYGVIDGEITSISDDATVDEQQGLIYGTHLLMKQNTIQVKDRTAKLMPGMAVTAEVKTGTRRIIEFFLAPLLQHGQESLRER
jgi:hemolysin D